MPTTRRIAGVGASVGTGAAWTAPGNIVASDNNRASRTLTNFAPTSQQLKASSMVRVSGLPIPDGADITAGRVIVEGHANAAETQLQEVSFFVGEAIVGSAAAAQVLVGDGVDALYTFTPPATLTPAIVNDPDFNVRLRGQWNSGGSITARVDAVWDEYDWSRPASISRSNRSFARRRRR